MSQEDGADFVERVGWRHQSRALGVPLPTHGGCRGIQCDPQNGNRCLPSFVFLLVLYGLFSKKIFGILSQTSYEVK